MSTTEDPAKLIAEAEVGMKVGFIGLGRMGMPMSQRLLKAGFSLMVHNRSRGKVEELAQQGAHQASSPAEVTRSSDIVLTCLPDVSMVETVFLGEDGIIPAALPGQILVDHSTVSPSTSRQIAQKAEAKGASFLDAPISGGVERATDGTLTIMVGGDQDSFERARPVFEAFGENIRHVGSTGSGSVVKLINQLLCGVHSLAAAEALVLGAKAGADPQTVLEILATSWGTSFMLSRNGPVMLERDFTNARAPLRLYVKDLAIIHQFAKEIGSPTPMGDHTLEMFQEASSKGMGELDVSCLVLPLEERAGVQVSKPKDDVA